MNLDDYKLWTAIITPFNEDLSIDYDSFKTLLNEQVEAKNGILVLGSTGEALNIGLDDRKKIIDFTLEQNLKSPVMIGVGGHNIVDTKLWVEYLNTKRIDCVLFVTPIYAKPGDTGQYNWFKTLMNLTNKPVMLYNVPGRSGIPLSLQAVSKLKDHKNYWGIKDASGCVEKFKEYLKASGNKPVYCGDDGLFADFALNGSQGLISVAGNVWPKATHEYVSQCLSKTFDHKDLWTDAANSLFIASNPVPAKALLSKENRIKKNTMMPPLASDDLQDFTPLEKANTNIKQWFKEQR
jgi:4-hydroxy-tetrahydrodipicolinate synthase